MVQMGDVPGMIMAWCRGVYTRYDHGMVQMGDVPGMIMAWCRGVYQV